MIIVTLWTFHTFIRTLCISVLFTFSYKCTRKPQSNISINFILRRIEESATWTSTRTVQCVRPTADVPIPLRSCGDHSHVPSVLQSIQPRDLIETVRRLRGKLPVFERKFIKRHDLGNPPSQTVRYKCRPHNVRGLHVHAHTVTAEHNVRASLYGRSPTPSVISIVNSYVLLYIFANSRYNARCKDEYISISVVFTDNVRADLWMHVRMYVCARR